MDAPTEHQFDLPVQKRRSQDPVKSLDGAQKWQSKLAGLMISGIGMLAYVSRQGLGSGPNLSLTVLYLGLIHLVSLGKPLGLRFNVQLDNTAADNKNSEMVFFLAWLVMHDVFEEGSFFCMIKGHTYSEIDQTFNTLISQMLGESMWTIGRMLQYVYRFLAPYNCLGVSELHCLWDWKTYFEPPVHERFKGIGSGQFGSGMHEFLLRKDSEGVVRLYMRKSSQASSWLPDGEGFPVFKTAPTGPPLLAAGKPDHAWSRETVYTTIRSWFRFMDVSDAEGTQIRADWERRFDGLPPDGDVEQLPDAMKLHWQLLPTRESVRRGGRVSRSSARSVPQNILLKHAQKWLATPLKLRS